MQDSSWRHSRLVLLYVYCAVQASWRSSRLARVYFILFYFILFYFILFFWRSGLIRPGERDPTRSECTLDTFWGWSVRQGTRFPPPGYTYKHDEFGGFSTRVPAARVLAAPGPQAAKNCRAIIGGEKTPDLKLDLDLDFRANA